MTPGLRRVLLRTLNFLRPSRAEPELEREIAAHLALLEQEFRRRGLAPDQARLAARRAFGGIDQTREMHRDARSFPWLEDVVRDLRYASRTLLRTPAFTVAAVLTLAIGIGGSTAVFSLFNAVLLRPLPFPDAGRLMLVFEENTKHGFPTDAVRPRNYAAWAAENDVFTSLAATTDLGVVVGGDGEPERLVGRRVTRSFFGVLGAQPLLGRVFTADEDRPGGPRVAILSYGLWQRRFGGDRAIVGRDVLLDQERFVVVGVMPREFQFLEPYVRLWVPAAFSSDELASGGRYLIVVGRLKPGVDAARARATLDTIAARHARLYPDDERWQSLCAAIVPFEERVSGGARRPLGVLLAAVGIMLLITCANLASLLLARAAARGREIALRGALGASRARIVRQLLTESVALAAMGLGVGVLLARWAFTFLEQLVPSGMALFTRPALDRQTLAVAVAVTVVTGLLFGLAPALQTTAIRASEALRSGGRSTSGAERGRRGLVVAQVAMTLVLLVGAGLLLQTLYQLRYADLGLRPDGVLTLRTALPLDRYGEHARRVAFYDRVLERVERLPGVAAAGYSTSIPLEWKGGTSEFAIEGRAPDPQLPYDANHRQVSAGYLQALGVPLRRGRYFQPADDARAPAVAIVNETLARQYWPGRDPIGSRIAIDPPRPGADDRVAAWRTVVGVVGDVRQMGLDAPARAEVYLPYRQFDLQPWFTPRDLVVRTAGNPVNLVNAVKRQVHAVDPGLAVSNIRTFEEVLDEDVAARRVGATLLAAFAAFALLLAVVGIYGVIAYFVVQHMGEMGIRIALGAGTGDIVCLVVRKGMALAMAGVAVGTIAALGATKLMSAMVTDTAGGGATMCVVAGAILLAMALVASYLPARRVTRLDPVAALRSE